MTDMGESLGKGTVSRENEKEITSASVSKFSFIPAELALLEAKDAPLRPMLNV